MKVTRTSALSGKTRTQEIEVTIEQMTEWANGKLIQVAMPNLTCSEREFIISGITDEEWESNVSD